MDKEKRIFLDAKTKRATQNGIIPYGKLEREKFATTEILKQMKCKWHWSQKSSEYPIRYSSEFQARNSTRVPLSVKKVKPRQKFSFMNKMRSAGPVRRMQNL